MTLDELKTRPTITVHEFAEATGVSEDNAYAAVKAGTIPSLKLGRRILIPVPHLLRILGDTTPTPPSA